MPRPPIYWIDTAGGSPGQMPRINDAGTEMEYVDPPSGAGTVESVVAGTGISVDDTDPANPVVSTTGGSGTQLVPLTTEIDGIPALVWDDDNQLVMTEVTL